MNPDYVYTTAYGWAIKYEEAMEENKRLRFALERIERHGPIMGSGNLHYRQGQLDILKIISGIARRSLENVEQAQPEAKLKSVS